MIDATLLLNGMTVFSPWFPRQADMLRVTAECVGVSGGTVQIQLYTKNEGETGNGDPVNTGVSISLSSPGRSTAEWKTVASQEGVQQQLRFRYVVTGSGNNDWILYRLLPAVWFDAVSLP